MRFPLNRPSSHKISYVVQVHTHTHTHTLYTYIQCVQTTLFGRSQKTLWQIFWANCQVLGASGKFYVYENNVNAKHGRAFLVIFKPRKTLPPTINEFSLTWSWWAIGWNRRCQRGLISVLVTSTVVLSMVEVDSSISSSWKSVRQSSAVDTKKLELSSIFDNC